MPTDLDAMLDELERLKKGATPGLCSVRLNPYTNGKMAYIRYGELDYGHYGRPADAYCDAALRNAASRLLAIARAAKGFVDAFHAGEPNEEGDALDRLRAVLEWK